MRGSLIRSAGALAVLPVLLAALATLLSAARGPFFQWGWTDPEYSYLLGALTIAEGSAPHHIDHPGTPLQTLGAGVVRAVDLLPGRPLGESLRLRVLRDPEHYLVALGAVLVFVCSAALYAAGYTVWNATGSLPCALVFQATPFLSWPAVGSLHRVAPEPLLLALGLCLGAGVVAAPKSADSQRWPLILGLLLGVGIATKVLFAALGLVPLVALTKRRARVRFALAAAFSLAFSLLPIWSELPRLVRWLVNLGLHAGPHGRGAASIANWPALVSSMPSLLRQEPLMFVAAGASLLFCALSARSRPPDARPLVRTLLAIVGAQAMLVVMVAKHPGPHYLVSGSALVGAMFVIWLELAENSPAPWQRRLVPAVVTVLALATVGWHATLLRGLLAKLEQRKRESRPATSLALSHDPRLLRGMRTSTPAAALQHGDFFANGRYADELRRVYPGFVIWDWTGLHHFGRPVRLRDHLETAGGRPFFRYLAGTHPSKKLGGDDDWTFEALWPIGPEMLYHVYPPRAGSDGPGAFTGFFDASGLADRVESPPQGRRGVAVRPGLRPATTVSFWSEGGPRRLVLAGRAEDPAGMTARVALDGHPVGDVEFPPPPAFGKQIVSFAAGAGVHDLQVVYLKPSEAGAKQDQPVVLYRRFAIE